MPKKNTTCQRISVSDAAKEIGCDADFVRQQMKKGKWDLGVVIPPQKKGGNYRYMIFRPKLDKFMGIEQEVS